MSRYPTLGKLKEPMKAFQQEHDPPYLGDVRPTIDLPAGYDLDKLTDFEVFDGEKWVSPKSDSMYKVQ